MKSEGVLLEYAFEPLTHLQHYCLKAYKSCLFNPLASWCTFGVYFWVQKKILLLRRLGLQKLFSKYIQIKFDLFMGYGFNLTKCEKVARVFTVLRLLVWHQNIFWSFSSEEQHALAESMSFTIPKERQLSSKLCETLLHQHYHFDAIAVIYVSIKFPSTALAVPINQMCRSSTPWNCNLSLTLAYVHMLGCFFFLFL